MRVILAIGSLAWLTSAVIAPVFDLGPLYALFSLICHQDPDRSFYLNQAPFAVCIRCTGIYLGAAAAVLLGLSPRNMAFRVAVYANAAEFALSLVIIDLAPLRFSCGAALGWYAAPIISSGIQEAVSRVIAKLVGERS